MGYNLFNYVDDFLGLEYYSKVHQAHAALKRLLENVGVGRSESKAVSPTQKIEFIGNLLNTIDMTIGVIPSRVAQLMGELESWRTKATTTRRQLELLIGKLQFISNCVRPGRLFISCLLSEMKVMRRGVYYKINVEA